LSITIEVEILIDHYLIVSLSGELHALTVNVAGYRDRPLGLSERRPKRGAVITTRHHINMPVRLLHAFA
jgi:hypothetical protein